MMLKTSRSFLLGLLGITLCTAAFSQQGFEMPPAAVVIANVEMRQLAPSVDVPGTVVSRHDARLASELSAKLEWIAEVGTTIKKGDAVARLEQSTFQLLEMQAQSRVKREQARVQFLISEKKRLDKLSEKNLSARSQLDQTVSDLAVAESDEEIARAQLGLAQIAMHVTSIRAPFDGIVTERLRSVGERLNVADEVIRLVDPKSLEVVARAPLNTVNFISTGVELDLHNEYRRDKATVRTIVPFGNPQSHMFEVRLDVDPEHWTVGESLRLSMPTANVKEVLAVPRDALILRREGASVFKVNADMTVEQVNVITGLGDGSHIEVIGELSAADRVITRGAERLSTGMKVSSNSSSQSNGAANAASR